MDFHETILIGGYLYTTAAFGWLYKQISKIRSNHLKHMEDEIKAIKKHVGMPDDSA